MRVVAFCVVRRGLPLRSVRGLYSAECGDWLLLCWPPRGGTVGIGTWMGLCPVTGESSLLFRVLERDEDVSVQVLA